MKRNLYYTLDKNGRKRVEVLEDIEEKNLKNKFILKKFSLDFLERKLNEKEVLKFFLKLKLFTENKYSFYDTLGIFTHEERIYPYVKILKSRIEEGKNLSLAFKETKLPLKNIDLGILKVGEETGNIYLAFEGIEKRLRKDIETREKLKKVLIYPVVVVTLIIILLYLLGQFILPSFIGIIEDNGSEIPSLTKGIIFISENILVLLLLILGVIFLIKILVKKYENSVLDFILKFRLIRDKINLYFISSYLKLMYILLEAGLSFSEGTKVIITSNEVGYYNKKLNLIHKKINEGSYIYSSLEEAKIFSKSDIELIKTGENSGRLTEVFRLISLEKERLIEEKINLFIKLLEPLTILIIGIIIGGIFLGIYLPILNLMDSI